MEILAFIFAAAALFGLTLWNGYRRARQVYLLSHSGLPVTGKIVRRWKRGGKRRRAYLRYEYSVGGNTYAHNRVVSQEVYAASAEGDPVALRYLPDQPSISATEQDVETSRQAAKDLAARETKP